VDEDQQALGRLERTAPEPTLVTDEALGYKPLGRVWPRVARAGRGHTLIGFAHLVSEGPNTGLFADVAAHRSDR
jgi:hypothetical protein